MAQFRKKPVVIEAVQFTGGLSSEAEISQWVGRHLRGESREGMRCLVIPTLEGDMLAQPDDWIIKGVAGEIYPCKPHIFTATYEPVA